MHHPFSRAVSKRQRIPALLVSVLSVLALFALSACSPEGKRNVTDVPPAPDPLLRSTTEGEIRGTREDTMLAFRGIPYAQPPVGERRFAPPEPAPARNGVLQANAFGPDCAQGPGVMGEGSATEDCLYLNVYTPETADNLPVMVWIHGGAFISGSGGTAYDPVRLVAEDMVVVTLNYRLGAFGFLAHPALSNEQSGQSGSYGLLDQKLALEWVRDNIAEFGGDPNNVTLFGESAGGHSVLSMIASPLTTGLFHKAILQSGSYLPTQIPLAVAEQMGAAAFAPCADTDCLRALSAEEVLALQAGLSNGTGVNPNYGSAILPEHSIESALASGNFQQVPVLAGTNLDEYTLFVGIDILQGATPPAADQYLEEIGGLIGAPAEDPMVAAIASFYPLESYGGSVWQAMGAIGTDAVFACNALRQAGQLAPFVSTYAYEFADRDAPVSLLPFAPEGIDLGASHAFEIPYLWGSEADFRTLGASDEQVALSQAMIRYWTRFARNGDPNGGSDAFWPAFNGDTEILTLAPGEPITSNAGQFGAYHRCAVWNPM